MVTLFGYFSSSLLAHVYRLLWYSVVWFQWPARRFSRNARSSGSSEGWPFHGSSSDFHPCVGLGLMCGWALPPPRTRPTCSNPYSDLTPPKISNKIHTICSITIFIYTTFSLYVFKWINEFESNFTRFILLWQFIIETIALYIDILLTLSLLCTIIIKIILVIMKKKFVYYIYIIYLSSHWL